MLRTKISFLILTVVLIALYAGGCRRAGSWLVKEDVPVHSDAMVLLMGSFPERVLQAVDLWHEGRADRIIIVEENMGPFRSLEERGVRIVSHSEQAATSLIALGIPEERITLLPGDARSTLTEAMIVSHFLADQPVTDTLLLVSSPSHMRRASMIFKAALSDAEYPVYIGSSPSAYSGFNPDRWWRRKEDVQAVLSEFVKIMSFILVERKKM